MVRSENITTHLTIMATRRVRHLAAWIADDDQAERWTTGNYRPVCGSRVKVGRARTTLLFPGAPVRLFDLPMCPRCQQTAIDLYTLAVNDGADYGPG